MSVKFWALRFRRGEFKSPAIESLADRNDRKSISSSNSRSALNTRDHTTVGAYRKGEAPENISRCLTAEGVWSSVDGSGRARTDRPLVLSGRLKQKAKVGRRKSPRNGLNYSIELRAMWYQDGGWYLCVKMLMCISNLPLSLSPSLPSQDAMRSTAAAAAAAEQPVWTGTAPANSWTRWRTRCPDWEPTRTSTPSTGSGRRARTATDTERYEDVFLKLWVDHSEVKNPLRLSELQSAHIFMAGERFKLQFVVALTQQTVVLFTPCSEFIFTAPQIHTSPPKDRGHALCLGCWGGGRSPGFYCSKRIR